MATFQSRLLMQIAEPDSVEANQPQWHEWGVWEHTRQVGNAIQHLPALDSDGVATRYLQELRGESIGDKSKYDLLLFALTIHDLGKTKPIAKKFPEGVFPSHDHHEDRSEKLIQRAMERGEAKQRTTQDDAVAEHGLKADKKLHALLTKGLKLTPEQITYVGRLAGLHFEFGKVRRVAGKNFTMEFVKGQTFGDACEEIFQDKEREEYQREIGLMFLLDSAGKTDKKTWKVTDVEEGEIPNDEQVKAMESVWTEHVADKDRPSLLDAVTSFQSSRAAALRYLKLLEQKRAGERAA